MNVAICIPTRGPADSLCRLLDSISGLEYGSGRVTTIVAVDGADPKLMALARGRGVIAVGVDPPGGSYAARNAAIDRLPDDVGAVLFTDSDCVVTPRWLSAHLDALRRIDRSGGPVHLMRSETPNAAEVVDSIRHLDQRFYVESLGFAATANLGVRRAVLDQVRFDPTLRSGGDYEFGRSAAQAGFGIAFTPGAVVQHPARNSAIEIMRKTWRVAGGAARLRQKGHNPSDRRRPRVPLRAQAAELHPTASRWWMFKVVALDTACRAVFAARVPSVAIAALRKVFGR